MLTYFLPAVLALVFLWLAVQILQEYERGVVFRLGRFSSVKEAGLRFIIPVVDRLVKVSLREVVMDVPSQDVITRDNVSVKVNAVLYFRVVHPQDAIIKVENYLYGTSQLAQTTLRSICGQAELDTLLSDRDRINRELQEELDRGTDPWGVKVTRRRDQAHRPAPRTCSGPWPSRPKPNANAAPRSSTRMASSRHRNACATPPRS